jgi:hypothetical protein
VDRAIKQNSPPMNLRIQQQAPRSEEHAPHVEAPPGVPPAPRANRLGQVTPDVDLELLEAWSSDLAPLQVKLQVKF